MQDFAENKCVLPLMVVVVPSSLAGVHADNRVTLVVRIISVVFTAINGISKRSCQLTSKHALQNVGDTHPKYAITAEIIHMKKLLDSDWLRAVQFKCNTGANSVTPVQITHRNSG